LRPVEFVVVRSADHRERERVPPYLPEERVEGIRPRAAPPRLSADGESVREFQAAAAGAIAQGADLKADLAKELEAGLIPPSSLGDGVRVVRRRRRQKTCLPSEQ